MKKYLPWLLVGTIFLVTLRNPADLDLGWHLRYGQYFFDTGQVLKENIISYVWPNYQWVEASWGYDLILYQVFSVFGFLGLSVGGYLISLATFLAITYPIKKFSLGQLLFLAVIFITQSVPLFSSGMRAQSLSALFVAYLILFFYKFFHEDKLAWWFHPMILPLFFLVWANLHGSFFLGLIFLVIYGFATLLLKKYKKTAILFSSIFLSWLTPLINPWGGRIYSETFKHSSSTNLEGISEWMPLSKFSVEWFLGLITIFLVLYIVIRRKKLWDFLYAFLFLIMAYLGFSATRFMVYFGIMATFYVAINIDVFLIRPAWARVLKIILIIAILAEIKIYNSYFRLPSKTLLTYNWDNYCKILYFGDFMAKDCSEEVTKVMLEDPPTGNGYNPYNYGGYLSWRVPQVKTFIDGRMATWAENGITPPVEDGDQIYIERTPLTFIRLDNVYHFRWMIVPTFSPIISFLDDLVKNGVWELRYRDDFYSYYVKIK